MFLQRQSTKDLIEVLDLEKLFNPCGKTFTGRSHCGEEMQDPEIYNKEEMTFLSGEKLPRCWLESSNCLREF